LMLKSYVKKQAIMQEWFFKFLDRFFMGAELDAPEVIDTLNR
jgi:hypothetical protein